jgi:hypothetical protein
VKNNKDGSITMSGKEYYYLNNKGAIKGANLIIKMKHPYSVKDIEGNSYCIVEPNQFQYYEHSNIILFGGFYGYILNDKFVPSSRRKHLDPKILFIRDGREEQQFYKVKKSAEKE